MPERPRGSTTVLQVLKGRHLDPPGRDGRLARQAGVTTVTPALPANNTFCWPRSMSA